MQAQNGINDVSSLLLMFNTMFTSNVQINPSSLGLNSPSKIFSPQSSTYRITLQPFSPQGSCSASSMMSREILRATISLIISLEQYGLVATTSCICMRMLSWGSKSEKFRNVPYNDSVETFLLVKVQLSAEKQMKTLLRVF